MDYKPYRGKRERASEIGAAALCLGAFAAGLYGLAWLVELAARLLGAG